jgi:dihydropteroate synthase
MHWRGPSVDMQSRARYDDVVADVRRELAAREGTWCVRVHEARGSRDAAEVASALAHHPAHERARS